MPIVSNENSSVDSCEPSSATWTSPSVPLPPSRTQNVDDVLELLNRTPLFMTELDETDGSGGSNADLEALKALAYEGTRAEVAANFKTQGNECVKSKLWSDAREYYGRALAVLKEDVSKTHEHQSKEGALLAGNERAVVDLDEEAAKEKHIEESCYVNRALCNLELKNYGSCNRDCASALRLNPRNVKAYYRSALACFSLDKIAAASDACNRALALDASNSAVQNLVSKVNARKAALEKSETERLQRLQRQQNEAKTLQQALKDRNISLKWTREAPEDVQDAKITLAEPLDASSLLSIPVLFLYPTAAQSDLIKAYQEVDNLLVHLDYILPCPWDAKGEFTIQDIECYMETVSGGLAKVGKKVPMAQILGGGKIEVRDGLVRVYIVPKNQAEEWLSEFKRRQVSTMKHDTPGRGLKRPHFRIWSRHHQRRQRISKTLAGDSSPMRSYKRSSRLKQPTAEH